MNTFDFKSLISEGWQKHNSQSCYIFVNTGLFVKQRVPFVCSKNLHLMYVM